jgi:hypothetical protein
VLTQGCGTRKPVDLIVPVEIVGSGKHADRQYRPRRLEQDEGVIRRHYSAVRTLYVAGGRVSVAVGVPACVHARGISAVGNGSNVVAYGEFLCAVKRRVDHTPGRTQTMAGF